MTEKKLATLCLMVWPEQKKNLQRWAAAEERSVSYIVRKILEAEARRRNTRKEQKQD